jgi:hypothetical protein
LQRILNRSKAREKMGNGDRWKLECRIKKWKRRWMDVVFLIDGSSSSLPAIAYEATSGTILFRKEKKLRPLRSYAYHCSYVESLSGERIVDWLTKTGEDAGRFAERIMAHARPIPAEDFEAELERLRLPHERNMQLKVLDSAEKTMPLEAPPSKRAPEGEMEGHLGKSIEEALELARARGLAIEEIFKLVSRMKTETLWDYLEVGKVLYQADLDRPQGPKDSAKKEVSDEQA